MAENTSIEWCDSSWNPWIGCTKVGPGCDNCYAEADFDLRKHRAKWGPGNPRSRTSPANWKKPLQWNAQPFSECMKCGWRGELRDAEIVKNPPGFHPPVDSASLCPGCHHPMLKAARRRVFCASLADVFDNEVPEHWRADLFTLIDETPNLDWLILTKRIGNAERMMVEATRALRSRDPGRAILHNVWLGATVVNQEEADRDIIKLLQVPARVRFLSMEPLLGLVDLNAFLGDKNADYQSRGSSLSSCDLRRTDDRSIRGNLADCGATGESLARWNHSDSMRSPTCGEDERKLSSGSRDVRVSQGRRDGAPVGMEALQRPHSGRHDGESQERDQNRECANQSGVSDDLGSGITRDPRSGVEAGAKLSWVVVGGESGTNARPMHPDWAYSLADQCNAAGIPLMFKQWGEWVSAGARAFGTASGEVRHIRSDGTFWNEDDPALQDESADVLTVVRVGKKAAGRDLGGKLHDGYPEARP